VLFSLFFHYFRIFHYRHTLGQVCWRESARCTGRDVIGNPKENLTARTHSPYIYLNHAPETLRHPVPMLWGHVAIAHCPSGPDNGQNGAHTALERLPPTVVK
jgi:hypothetical protein